MKYLKKIFDLLDSPTIKMIIYLLLFFLLVNVFLHSLLKIDLNISNIVVFYILLIYLNLVFIKNLKWKMFLKPFSTFKIIVFLILFLVLLILKPVNIHLYIWVLFAYIFFVFDINMDIVLILVANVLSIFLFNYSILWFKSIWFLYDYCYYLILVYIILYAKTFIVQKNLKLPHLFWK